MMIKTVIIGSMVCVIWPLFAQAQVTEESRAQEIESARAEREANLQPEGEPQFQRHIQSVQNNVVYKLATSGINGFAVGFGQLRAGNGFAIGPQFSRSDLMGGRLSFRTGARGSLKKSYIGNVNVSVRDLAGGHVFVDFRAEHRNLSEMAY